MEKLGVVMDGLVNKRRDENGKKIKRGRKGRMKGGLIKGNEIGTE